MSTETQAPSTDTVLTTVHATQLGRDYAAAVSRGLSTPERAGDAWVRLADRSHSLGQAFLLAYDSAGGER